MRKFLFGATALLGLAAVSSETVAPASAQMVGRAATQQARTYVTMAGASDLFEIESSRLAVQRARMPATRQYAQMLIQHHMQTTAQVTAAARASGITPPPPRLMPMQRRMIARLRATRGAGFDRLYMSQQVPAHEMALALHSGYAQRGDVPALRTVASNAVPIVTQHLQQARAMAR